ncbi:hypothetical protein GQX73_g1323 [Xylaria multiplex]|uniref:FAD/NAD(P)-binding domain-containing protein n=1 Tax=Xylaria multiplex TaxID=323545 RepID=A0A7C8J0U3_9PEZI|nr:hypothetical protein GQX73_g1323 [Xylaria multiplex]
MNPAMADIPALLDVAIIGAGFYGLKAAQTYLKLDPDAKLAIFERYNTVGGTWSRDRIYPSLVAQVEYGYFNYPDSPMSKDGAANDNLVSGNMIFNYLDRFANEHDLKRRIHFDSWVSNVQRCNRGWRLTVNGRSVESRKLIIASGITSVKNSPSFEVKEGSIPVIHSIDIAQNAQDLSSNNVQHCLVLGAAKSAYDVVTSLGRWLTKAHWSFITSKAIKVAGFGGNAGSVEGLRPDVKNASCFWCDSSLGLITLGDFWSKLQKGNITIIRDNVDVVDASGALLRSGRRVDVDRVIYCTGWGDHFSFFSEAVKEELGIPQYGDTTQGQASVSSSEMNDWRVHEEAADIVVAQKLPLLAAGPKELRSPSSKKCITRRRWRLYNRCIPLSTARNEDRSIVILGQIHTTQTPTISAIQCLWAVAYLLGEVAIPTEDCMVKEVAQWNAWTRKRYSSVGERYPYALFDWIPYLDCLLKDLGVRTQRKRGVFANFLAPYGPSDYDGVLDEYMVIRKKNQNAES